MVITSIGDETEMGRIAQSLQIEQEDTPLQKKLGKLGGAISKISSAIAALLFIFMLVKMIINHTLHVDTSGFMPFLN